MNLEDFASVAEIVGGIAVIISLIYVGLQVNDSASAARSTAASDATVVVSRNGKKSVGQRCVVKCND